MIYKSISYTSRLLWILAIKSCLIILYIAYGGLGLGPDEAQYWTWSQALDFGYYSKPPGIAWQIGLGTMMLGNTELGVRFVSVIIAFAQTFAVYRLALICLVSPRAAFWCGIAMAFCPLGIFGSIFAITDGGMLLFWTIACIILASGLRHPGMPDLISVGFWIMCGALFKWSIYVFWVYVAIFYCLYFPFRDWIKKFAFGVGISLLGLLPSVWWNWGHEWATFRHVGSTLQGGHGSSSGNFFEFIGSQALLLSPVLFVLLLLAYKYSLKRFKNLDRAQAFCLIFSCTSLLFFSCVSLFQKIQGNWILFAYPTGIVLIGMYCEAHLKTLKWMKWGVAFSLIFVSIVLQWPSYNVFYRKSPFKHNLGWGELNRALRAQGYDPETQFLVADKYQTSSILSFYGEGQKRAYFLNLEGNRKNQFSYWPNLQTTEIGNTGYFVWIENIPHLEKSVEQRREFYLQELFKYFERVESSPLIPLIIENKQIVKGALFFKCKNCKDVRPNETLKY